MADVIIGWDFGHGENAAEALRVGAALDGVIPLNLDLDKAREAPTVILYWEGGVRIGRQAQNNMAAIPYFKARPDQWDGMLAGHAKRDMMADYFRVMMESIRLYNPQVIRSEDKILLLVGCPSSRSWLEPPERLDAYQALIREATGVDEVIVMPESRAALFSMLSPGGGQAVSIAQGAVVFDCGSSTLDATYMSFGEYMLERSCTLGASHIERAMLRKILEDHDLSPADIWDQEIGALEMMLREQKERYFSVGGLRSQVLSLTMLDEQGEPLKAGQDRRGKTLYKMRDLTYLPDDAFMDAVTETLLIEVEADGASLGMRTWKEHLRGFITDIREELDRLELPRETVILTGGASRMPVVTEICQEVFGKAPLCEANPSRSVSRGLCLVGEADRKLPELIRAGVDRVRLRTESLIEKMVDDGAEKLARRAYNAVEEVLGEAADGSGITTVGDLREGIEDALELALTEERVEKVIRKQAGKWLLWMEKLILQVANDATSDLYPDRAGDEHLLETVQALEEMTEDLDDVAEDVADSINYESLARKIVTQTLTFMNNIFIDDLDKKLSVAESIPLPGAMRRKMLTQYMEQGDDVREMMGEKIAKRITKALKDSDYWDGQKIHALAEAATRQAIDIVSLKYFAHRDESDV